MVFQEDCKYCPYWDDWNGRCSPLAVWCPTRERAEQIELEINGENEDLIGGEGRENEYS